MAERHTCAAAALTAATAVVTRDDDAETDDEAPLGLAAPHTEQVSLSTSHSVRHSPQCHKLLTVVVSQIDPFFTAVPALAPAAPPGIPSRVLAVLEQRLDGMGGWLRNGELARCTR